MANSENGKRKHFILEGFTKTETYKRPPRKIDSKIFLPELNRNTHGNALLRQINAIKPVMGSAVQFQIEAGIDFGLGIQIEFVSFPDIDLAFERLSRERSGIELLNIRHEKNQTFANVFVPDGKLEHFERLLREYLEEKRDKNGDVRDHKSLIHTIQQIRAATLKALWTDDPDVFPDNDEENFWWEAWLPVRKNRKDTLELFYKLAEIQNVQVAPGAVEFPERTVVLVKTSKSRMQQSMMTINCIAELRRAKETAEFFDSLKPEEQPEWTRELIGRTSFNSIESNAPYICILDTGVNQGHPLISPSISNGDMHSVEPAWGVHDDAGHGTNMAGLSLFGNLTEALESSAMITIEHGLESVKLLKEDGSNQGDANHHAYLTSEAVNRPEVSSPHRQRVFEMAVTTKDYRDRGRPSAWSAMIDALTSDSEDYGANPRLMIVSAGNINDPNAWNEYPNSNSTDGIHDPGQAWNALTIGAYTEMTTIAESDCEHYSPVAGYGGLSPFSTTSSIWQSIWPLKPDVVFEGGNVAKDTYGSVWMHSLSLLTTNHRHGINHFTTIRATSAATALAARMAAQLIKAYPNQRPETIRALIVHSAEWTDNMKNMFLPQTKKANKSDYLNLVRHCGFGVPDLDRAMWSASNSLTLLVEESFYPFVRKSSNQPKYRDMHFHYLPWPLPELESLGETQVEMRVTLSYFIEPNPSQRGFKNRYSYESHGLRFDVKRPLESEKDFRMRINAMARAEEKGSKISNPDNKDEKWCLGTNNRHKGSIHSDIWCGSAAELASRGVIAVFPTSGWWKTRYALKGYEKPARYSLVVSIHAPKIDVDLYAAIVDQIKIKQQVDV